MNVKITASKSRDGKKIWYGLEWGRGPGQRQRTGIYTWAKAWTPEERKFNQEQLRLLKALQANTLLKLGAQKIGIAPRTIQKNNFFEYYEEYVRFNQRPGNRHLSNSLIHFKEFVKKEYQKEKLKPSEIDEKMCLRFREYLLKRFKGETPANYFARFKKVVASAYKDGYFDKNPTDEIASKANPRKPKDILESEEEFLALINAPCKDIEVKRAYTFSLYTGMSWVDVYNLTYDKIKGDSLLYQRGKTQQYAPVPLHKTALKVLDTVPRGRPDEKVFKLPSSTHAKRILSDWVKNAGINKNLTWHSARHSMSVLLQLRGVDPQTVAGILGHTTTKYVQTTYKRYVTSAAREAIQKLPG